MSRRRLASVALLPRVTIFSTIGRISLALASVVCILPRSMSERASDLSKAARWPFSLPNFLFTFPCLIVFWSSDDPGASGGQGFLLFYAQIWGGGPFLLFFLLP